MKIKIEGVPGHNGEYKLDLSYLTNRELHTIKRLAGVRAGEIEEALGAGDSDLMVALGVVAMIRDGRKVNEGALWDAPVGKLTAIVEEEETEAEDDAGPPAQSGSASPVSESEKPASSGASSNGAGDENPASVPSSTGSQGSDTGSASAQQTSVT